MVESIRRVGFASMWCSRTALSLCALLGLGGASALAANATLEVGATFPELTALDFEGELPDLSAASVVIVDFWASWCGPCKQSFPVYEELQRTYADRGVVIIAVNVDRNRRDMEKFLARHAVSFAVVRDAAQKLVSRVAPPAMPTAFVLDRRRAVRFVHLGFHGEKSRLEYVTEINALLSETP